MKINFVAMRLSCVMRGMIGLTVSTGWYGWTWYCLNVLMQAVFRVFGVVDLLDCEVVFHKCVVSCG
jgi:hypothetical protein